uniref:TMEM131_like domain-containing protein n=1 Tax=Macrostomum lignano TaxID=282301 RepID=A0A1I8F2D5_9PLAT
RATGGNATFDVVFLATRAGTTENTLYIRTSAASTAIRCSAWPAQPYRVRGHAGRQDSAECQLCASLQLLQSKFRAAAGSPWRIPPYETRTLMRLRLIGRSAANHSAFVRLRTSLGGPGLVLPVQRAAEATALRVTSLYSEPTLVSSAELDSPNPAVQLLFRPVQVLPGPARETPVAIVVFRSARPPTAGCTGLAIIRLHRRVDSRPRSAQIILRGGDSRQLLSVPYEAGLLHGALTHAEKCHLGTPPMPIASEGRRCQSRTRSTETVAVTGVELPQSATAWSVVGFKPPALDSSRQDGGALPLRLNASAAAGRQAELRLTAAARARLSRPRHRRATDAVTRLEFALRNDNPLPVSLESVSVPQLAGRAPPADSGAGRLGPASRPPSWLTSGRRADFYGVVDRRCGHQDGAGRYQSVQYGPSDSRRLPAPDPRFSFPAAAAARLAEADGGLTTESAAGYRIWLAGLTVGRRTASLGPVPSGQARSPWSALHQADQRLAKSGLLARQRGPVMAGSSGCLRLNCLSTQVGKASTADLILENPTDKTRAHLPVTFRPTESGEFRALFLLRNNLTGVEPLLAVGRGARVELRASADSMEFGLAGATGLEPPCQRHLGQLTIVNPGPLTVDSGPPIVGRDASGCSDAPGFMVAPCAPIRLGPNESLHMAVTFTPTSASCVQLGSFAWSAALFASYFVAA